MIQFDIHSLDQRRACHVRLISTYKTTSGEFVMVHTSCDGSWTVLTKPENSLKIRGTMGLPTCEKCAAVEGHEASFLGNGWLWEFDNGMPVLGL